MEDIVRLNINDKVKVCPYCGHEEVTRYGKYNKKQRYKCKSCKKTFTDFTRSPIFNSKKDIDLWIKYVSCMINGYSIRKCAKEVGISVPTSFYWRHKVLDAVRAYLGMGNVGGVAEADETFFRESFKGNHKKSTNFVIPREARKRGPTGSFSSMKETKDTKRKRGISDDQVCVLYAIDRAGNMISELICKGRMKSTDVERLFNDKMEKDSILCTDSHHSYVKFTQKYGLEHQRIKRGRHKEGVYHIQHVNAFHNNLGYWMDRFRGVSTKYLSNYLYWFKWLCYFNAEKDAEKSKHLFIHSHTAHTDTKLNDFKIREALFV